MLDTDNMLFGSWRIMPRRDRPMLAKPISLFVGTPDGYLEALRNKTLITPWKYAGFLKKVENADEFIANATASMRDNTFDLACDQRN